MKIYKIAQNVQENIQYISNYNVGGFDFVLFRIGEDFWAYRLSFPDWVNKVKQIAVRSNGKALAYAKSKKSKGYKVTKDFPMPGSIIIEEI